VKSISKLKMNDRCGMNDDKKSSWCVCCISLYLKNDKLNLNKLFILLIYMLQVYHIWLDRVDLVIVYYSCHGIAWRWERWVYLLSVLKISFCFNHKIIIMKFRSRHLVLWLLGNLWSTRVWVKDWLCKEKMHHPQCTLLKIGYIVVWLFFWVMFLSVGLFLRSKINLLLWGSLYLIRLKLNCYEAWILVSHLFHKYNYFLTFQT
jgi:hypothetical protein